MSATPYYQDENVTLYLGDCLEITEWLEADVLVTDPPYGMALETGRRTGWQSRWAGTVIAGDEDVAVRDAVLELWGSRPGLVFGTWKRPMPAGVREVLVWDKVVSTGMGALDIPWRPSWESIYVLGSGWSARRRHGVIRCSLPTLAADRKWHPTVKPAPLMRELIDACPPGVIADPFAGSGTTLVAAKALGRRAIGVEIDERYCETAARRLSQGVLDLGGSS